MHHKSMLITALRSFECLVLYIDVVFHQEDIMCQVQPITFLACSTDSVACFNQSLVRAPDYHFQEVQVHTKCENNLSTVCLYPSTLLCCDEL